VADLQVELADTLHQQATESLRTGPGYGYVKVTEQLKRTQAAVSKLPESDEREVLQARTYRLYGDMAIAVPLPELVQMAIMVGEAAVDIYTRSPAVGPHHGTTALAHVALGNLHARSGQWDRGRQAFEKALAAYEKAPGYGPKHAVTRSITADVGLFAFLDNRIDRALEFCRRALALEIEAARTVTFGGIVERGSGSSLRRSPLTCLSVVASSDKLTDAGRRADLEREIFAGHVRLKGAAFAFENGLAVLAGGADQRTRELARRYASVRQELGQLYGRAPVDIEVDAPRHAVRIRDLELEKSGLEGQLARRMSRFDELRHALDVDAGRLRAVLRSGEVYVDYFSGGGFGLFAFTLDGQGRTRLHKLPVETEKIETAVRELRQQIDDGGATDAVRPLARTLFDALVRPLGDALDGATSLLISPDGLLHLLPFEMLLDGDRFLLERYTVRYTPTGRDVVRLRTASGAQPGPEALVFFGNPAFTGQVAAATPGAPVSSDSDTRGPLDGGLAGPPDAALSELLVRHFGTRNLALPGTQQEVDDAAKLFGPRVRAFTAANATAANLMALDAPRLLHIATHGFFLERADVPNPLLRSGLVFAGAASAWTDSRNDGVLTALQLSGLRLQGTDLVVLSACDTGRGTAVVGEGVAGLNQAFFTAGARRVISSLWQVLDRENADLIARFYEKWAQRAGAADALREAKLEALRAGRVPKVWAALVVHGD
jgi:CHAT domain-containing protein